MKSTFPVPAIRTRNQCTFAVPAIPHPGPPLAALLPEPTNPQELAGAMAETCIRLALRRIQSGELKGSVSPDTITKWRVIWGPIGGGEVLVSIVCRDDLDHDVRAAATERLRALDWSPQTSITRGGGCTWEISVQVREHETA